MPLCDTMRERFSVVRSLELGGGGVQPLPELVVGLFHVESCTGETSPHRIGVHSCPRPALASMGLNRFEFALTTVQQVPVAVGQRFLLRAAHLA